ncbi:type VI secretion system tube protein TssD (plasmid) [Escherichia coli]|nr:type VI secretion system tube protein TssD [Escherichia coli]
MIKVVALTRFTNANTVLPISITGQTQGNITAGAFTADSVGNIYVQGHEDEMLVQEFLHNVAVPTDPQSGQPAGQRAPQACHFLPWR